MIRTNPEAGSRFCAQRARHPRTYGTGVAGACPHFLQRSWKPTCHTPRGATERQDVAQCDLVTREQQCRVAAGPARLYIHVRWRAEGTSRDAGAYAEQAWARPGPRAVSYRLIPAIPGEPR